MTLLTSCCALDREPPPAAEPAPFTPPPCPRFELGNGLQAILVENHTVPVITMSWLARAGSQYDPAGREGLASLVTPLLLEGTARRSASQIIEATELLGSRILTGFDWDGAFLSFDLLRDDLDPALELLAEVALSPAFPQPAVEGWRRRRLAELKRRQREPVSRLEDTFSSVVYEGTVYGRSFFGSEASLRGVSEQDLKDFHRVHFGPSGAFLLAVGSFSTDAMVQRLQSLFPGVEAAPDGGERRAPVPPAIAPSPAPGTRVVLVDHPGAAQTWLCIGHAGVASAHPDFARLDVLNAILGGMYTSRLNLELRERLGYTYDVRTQFVQRGGPGPFMIRAAVGHENVGAVVKAIARELVRLQQEPVSPVELEDARGFLSGRIPQRFQTSSWTLRQLHQTALYDLSEDYFESYLEEIRQIDREGVMRLARAHLHPDQLTIVAVGPAEKLRSQLASWSDSDNVVAKTNER